MEIALPMAGGGTQRVRLDQLARVIDTVAKQRMAALLDGKPVGSGKPGPVFHAMYKRYQEFKQKVMRAGKERQAA